MEVECLREVLSEIKKNLPAHYVLYYSNEGFTVQVWRSVSQSYDDLSFISDQKDPFLTQLNKLLEHLKPIMDYKKFLELKEIICNKVEFKDALQCL